MEDTTMTNNHNIERYSLPPPAGYVFRPSDDQLIDFLKVKLESRNSNFNSNVHDPFQDFINRKIPDLDVYDQLPNPENLSAGRWKLEVGQKGWFFFTPRKRRFLNGKRPKRTTSEGTWKASTAERPIVKNSKVIGYMRSLVFNAGCKKTDWLMKEYWCTNIPNNKRTNSGDLKFNEWDDWVLCLIYKKHKARSAEKQVKMLTAEEQKSLGTSNSSILDIDQILSFFQSSDQQAGCNIELMKMDNNAQQAGCTIEPMEMDNNAQQAGCNIEPMKIDNNAQQAGWASFQSSDEQAESEYFTKSADDFFYRVTKSVHQ